MARLLLLGSKSTLRRVESVFRAVCTICGKEFVGVPAKNPDEAILKIKATFKEHKCKDAQHGKSNGLEDSHWIC